MTSINGGIANLGFMSETLLKVENLDAQFSLENGYVPAVNGVSFSIAKGEVLGIVGESGSGKSVTALSLLRLIDPPGEITAGKAMFYGGDEPIDLLQVSSKELQKIAGTRISMIFQDAMASLNPVLSVGFQIAETLRVHRGLTRKAAKEHTIYLLERVGIANAAKRSGNYPHEFSGGMRQRVLIAMAIACQPKLLIADEPTTALDVTIQAQILSLLREFTRDFGMSIILISHDLGVIAQLADKVAVMYAGRIVESGPVDLIFHNPQHPYTQALAASIPRLHEYPTRLVTIEGSPPRAGTEDSGRCSFYPRCSQRIDICAEKRPRLTKILPKQFASCWVAQQGALADV